MSNRNLPVDTERRSARYTHVAANGSSDDVGTGSGIFVGVVINTEGASSNTLTIYDSLTHGAGTTIAVIDTTKAIGTIPYMVRLSTGLSYTMATGTAADVTILYQ